MAAPRSRRGLRRLASLGALTLVAALSTACRPALLLRAATAEAADHPTLFPTRSISASSSPRPLPMRPAAMPGEVPWKGKDVPFARFLTETHTMALVIVHRGAIVHEWYGEGYGPASIFPSMSVAKSVVSVLTGQEIARGRLRESDRVVDVVREAATGGAFDQVTVGHLLDMTSGIDVSEDYDTPTWLLPPWVRLYLSDAQTDFLMSHRALRFAPGSKAEYRSVDTAWLGLVLERITGKRLADLVTERLWQPMGAERDATWGLDRENGSEKGFCCLNARARDFARFGMLLVGGTTPTGERVIPAPWLQRIRKPTQTIDGWGYGALFWHPAPAEHPDFSAIGVLGQYVYVDPSRDVVVVKLSNHAIDADEMETLQTVRHVATFVAGG